MKCIGTNLNSGCVLSVSPSNFDTGFLAYELYVDSPGELTAWGPTWSGCGVRPVINLNTDNLTFTGSGTAQDPFVVS